SGCIEATWTCCADRTGGCSPSEYCSLGDNGEYGCCPNDEICDGPGSAVTTGGGVIFCTDTIFEAVTSASDSDFTKRPAPAPTLVATST
ncbi:hypothetical protein AOQ84DRAFT_275388, partial [Glonium stellatum]